MKDLDKLHLHQIMRVIDKLLIKNWYKVETLEKINVRTITKNMIKKFYSRNVKDVKKDWDKEFPEWEKFFKKNRKVINSLYYFDFWVILECLDNNDVKSAIKAMQFYMFKIEQSMVLKYFKTGIAREDLLRRAMDEVSGNHLFKKYHGIGETIKHLSNDLIIKNMEGLKKRDMYAIGKTMMYGRTRFEQSFQALARKYYSLIEQENSKKDTDTVTKHEFQKKIETYINTIINFVQRGMIHKHSVEQINRILSLNNTVILKMIETTQYIDLEDELRRLLQNIFLIYKDDMGTLNSTDGWKKLTTKMKAKRVNDKNHVRYTSKQLLSETFKFNSDIENIYQKYSNNMKFKMELVVPLYLYFIIRFQIEN